MSVVEAGTRVGDGSIDVVQRRAMEHYRVGEMAEVEQLYRNFLSLHPNQPDASYNLGIVTLLTRRFGKSLPYLKSAFDTNPAHSQYWSAYLVALLQNRHFRQAAEVIHQAARAGVPAEQVTAISTRLEVIARKVLLEGMEWMPDLLGDSYLRVLERLHAALRPAAYLEIGVETGATLALARCPSLGIDPRFRFQNIATVQQIVAKPSLLLYQMASDDFFATLDPGVLLGRPIELAFLDGMHRCEYLLRDFLNTERHCRRDSVIVLHDCLPTEMPMAAREPGSLCVDPHRQKFWAGDVWRTALLLKRRRPDLRMIVLDSPPTGLILVTNLDPRNTYLAENHESLAIEMLGWSLDKITLPGYYDEMQVEPEVCFRNPVTIASRLRPCS